MTLPSADGQCWVFIDPSRPDLAFNRRFASTLQAADYAVGLAKTTGWPIEDATGQCPRVPKAQSLDQHQLCTNEAMWQMSAVAQQPNHLDWNDPSLFAVGARLLADLSVAEGRVMTAEDRAMLIEVGAAMLLRAAADLGVASVDDVLASTLEVAEA
jgi:hypothetical protein